jgi:hypothetical protein
VTGSTVLAIAFVEHPALGQPGCFVALFAGLSLVALAGIAVNARVAERHASTG